MISWHEIQLSQAWTLLTTASSCRRCSLYRRIFTDRAQSSGNVKDLTSWSRWPIPWGPAQPFLGRDGEQKYSNNNGLMCVYIYIILYYIYIHTTIKHEGLTMVNMFNMIQASRNGFTRFNHQKVFLSWVKHQTWWSNVVSSSDMEGLKWFKHHKAVDVQCNTANICKSNTKYAPNGRTRYVSRGSI